MSLQKEGLTRSIGISNFTIEDLDEMLYGDGRAPEVLPAVCQIELHPYVWKEQRGMVEYCQSKVGKSP